MRGKTTLYSAAARYSRTVKSGTLHLIPGQQHAVPRHAVPGSKHAVPRHAIPGQQHAIPAQAVRPDHPHAVPRFSEPDRISNSSVGGTIGAPAPEQDYDYNDSDFDDDESDVLVSEHAVATKILSTKT
mgnify:CR=1 FL=1